MIQNVRYKRMGPIIFVKILGPIFFNVITYNYINLIICYVYINDRKRKLWDITIIQKQLKFIYSVLLNMSGLKGKKKEKKIVTTTKKENN